MSGASSVTPSVLLIEVKLWTRIPFLWIGSTEKSRAEGKAVVARMWPLDLKWRFSNPLPSEEKILVTGSLWGMDGGMEVGIGWMGTMGVVVVGFGNGFDGIAVTKENDRKNSDLNFGIGKNIFGRRL